MKIPILTIAVTLALALAAREVNAQRRGGRPVVKAQRNKSATPTNALLTQLLPATAKVMVVDSGVVRREDFLKSIPTTPDMGTVEVMPGRYLPDGTPYTSYTNGLKDRRIVMMGDTSATFLAMQERVGNQWGKAVPLEGISTDYTLPASPFLMPDGVTLYFTATGKHAVGKRDIFTTTYDADEGRWLEPQNVGLPFNSTDNDLFMAVDEADTLGWLVTDRRQGGDSVCVYTFVPTAIRRDYQSDGLSAAALMQRAELHDISQTWDKKEERWAALKRMRRLMETRQGETQTQVAPLLWITNARVARTVTDLRTTAARRLYMLWLQKQQVCAEMEQQLKNERQMWEVSPTASLRQTILSHEADYMKVWREVQQTAKEIRIAEER